MVVISYLKLVDVWDEVEGQRVSKYASLDGFSSKVRSCSLQQLRHTLHLALESMTRLMDLQ